MNKWIVLLAVILAVLVFILSAPNTISVQKTSSWSENSFKAEIIYPKSPRPPIKEYIQQVAKEYAINEYQFLETARCESQLFPQQSKIVKNGIREDSWGIWQIHLPSHSDITRDEAMDIEFSTNWSAQQFKEGKAWLWACWRNKFSV